MDAKKNDENILEVKISNERVLQMAKMKREIITITKQEAEIFWAYFEALMITERFPGR